MEMFLNSRKKEAESGLTLNEMKDVFTEEELLFLSEADEDNKNENYDSTNEESNTNAGYSPKIKRGSTKSNSIKINAFLFDRTKLILKLLRSCKEKLVNQKEDTLARGLEWLTKEVQDSMLFKTDNFSILKLENLKKQNKELQTIFSWLEEYSTIKIKKKDGVTKLKLKEVLSDESIEHIDEIPLSVVRNYFNNENSYNCIEPSREEKVKYLNYSEESIAAIEDSSFDIFKLQTEVGPENILSTVSCYIFTTLGFYSIVEYSKFETFIQEIAKGYIKENPYHNDLHAADVLQTSWTILKKGGIIEKLKLCDLDVCALLISAIIHDFRHPGVTNLFLINTGNQIALKYNDVSVLENYHVAEAFKLMKSKKDYDIFSQLSKEDYKTMRKRIVDSVLATDMSFHAKQFTYLKLKIESLSIHQGQNLDKIFNGLDKMGVYSTQQEFLNIIIHASDISNPTKPFHVYEKWADRVMQEFWKQGDKEKELSIPVSFLCDRNTVTLPAAQIGFMEGIVFPFVDALVHFFPDLIFLVENVTSNKAIFKKQKEEDEERKKIEK